MTVATQRLWTLDDLCAYLQISPATAYRMMRSGKLRRYKIRGQLRFRPADVETYVRGCRVDAAGAAAAAEVAP